MRWISRLLSGDTGEKDLTVQDYEAFSKGIGFDYSSWVYFEREDDLEELYVRTLVVDDVKEPHLDEVVGKIDDRVEEPVQNLEDLDGSFSVERREDDKYFVVLDLEDDQIDYIAVQTERLDSKRGRMF